MQVPAAMVVISVVAFAAAWVYGLRKVRSPVLRFAVATVVVYMVMFVAAWVYGGLRKVGSPDPGMVSEQALAPLAALIYTSVVAGIWIVLMAVRMLVRRLRSQPPSSGR
jgi:putative Mn2+ efflux pump MntP